MRNKTYVITASAVSFILMFLLFRGSLGQIEQIGSAMESISVFNDVDELDFLKPYVTEEYTVSLPEGATDGYKAKVNYEDREYVIEAYKFESEESALRYMWGSGLSEESQGKDLGHLRYTMEAGGEGSYTAAEKGSYFHMRGNYSDTIFEFISFLNDNMSIPVKTEAAP